VLDRTKPGPTAKWGPVKTWDEGLNLPSPPDEQDWMLILQQEK